MRKQGLYLLSTAVVLILPATSYAQDASSGTGGEIVVTAQLREQRLQDLPLSVSALSADNLRSQNITTIGDLGTGRIPGLAVGSLFGSEVSVSLNFRGLASNDPSQGTQDSPAALYIDGVNFPRSQGMSLELIFPERIEVLRGPQGQLFGRNAEGGAVQVISRKPTGEWNGEVIGQLAEYGTHSLRARIDLPSIAGFNIQLSGFGREHGGYTKNIKSTLLQDFRPLVNAGSKIDLGRGDYDADFSYLKTYGGRIAITKDLSSFHLFYSYDNAYADENPGFTHFVNAPAIAGTLNNPNGVNTPASVFTLQPGLTVFTQQPLDFKKYPKTSGYSLLSPPFITKSQGHNLTVNADVAEGLVVKSSTAYRKVSRIGLSFSSVGVSSVNPGSGEYVQSKAFSQEFQAVYGRKDLNVTAGVIYFHEDVEDQRDSFFSTNCGSLGSIVTECTPNGEPSRPPYVNSFYPAGVTDFRTQTSVTNSYAAYMQVSYTPPILDDALEITGGLRYSNGTKRGERTVASGMTLPTPYRNEAKSDRIDPALSVRFKFSSDISVYARYARGFRDGGANVRSETFGAFAEEELTSYEVGFKSRFFDRRVTFNVAAYSNKLKNYQFQFSPDPAIRPGVGDTVNAPYPLTTRGVEAELTAHIARGLSVFGNVSYIDAPDPVLIGLEPLGPTTLGVFVPEATYSPLTGLA